MKKAAAVHGLHVTHLMQQQLQLFKQIDEKKRRELGMFRCMRAKNKSAPAMHPQPPQSLKRLRRDASCGGDGGGGATSVTCQTDARDNEAGAGDVLHAPCGACQKHA